ncbi:MULTISPECIES: orotate phosphoribosyltransferase [Geobacillus]|jgi:orotate phosphoribosyltransferase|uniref:Orotate phosphoribosyltransferase n=1 Tax=Geobacillus thermodenitrificans (strain NG80-2) TaxID=420246 RepID=A4IM37_GEOTN|nr:MULTISPECIES: orotate phosphoribosyltransferase [Geobacillus]ABO66391.1 Orotate phosphoribosyltransferase [Geobacillus thermodenitrificans NG80-2]KQB93785.1 Orotate phosphoribosyltransferase [Geobacillus sp. PA-3]MED3718016.1 orotate phosphoribosyltransferase [Geobacillus thermodenitrificans]MED4918226.1 orotate phosphoribosyltransferase [Geobacillus thermodenitrificans]OQP10436.1 orotate phosphoribosyltransferase [Geobacillus sp. 47C-IIb]
MKHDIAAKLLQIGAVALQPSEPFTWSSGLKSPIYCDNRLTLAYPEVRRMIADGLADLIRTHFPEAVLIAGTATAGIPHAAWVSERLDLPMCYVRSQAKAHGKGKQIEGKAEAGQRVVVIEDLISTGGSSLNAVRALKEAGCDVLGVAAIFTYGLEKAKQAFAEANVPAYTLTDYDTLIETAVRLGAVSEHDLATLRQWRENPEEWGK